MTEENTKSEESGTEAQVEAPPTPEEYKSKTVAILAQMEKAGIKQEELTDKTQQMIDKLDLATSGFKDWDDRSKDWDESAYQWIKTETVSSHVADDMKSRSEIMKQQREKDQAEAAAKGELEKQEQEIYDAQKEEENEAKEVEETKQAKQTVVDNLKALYEKGKRFFTTMDLKKAGVPIAEIEKTFKNKLRFSGSFIYGPYKFEEEGMGDEYSISVIKS